MRSILMNAIPLIEPTQRMFPPTAVAYEIIFQYKSFNGASDNEKKLMAVAKLSSTLLIAPDRIPTNHTSFAC